MHICPGGVALCALIGLLAAGGPAFAEIQGGMINPETQETCVGAAAGAERSQYCFGIGTYTFGDGASDAAGRLYVVTPDGRVQPEETSFTDAAGVGIAHPSVAPETAAYSKVVYIDWTSRIIGGMGWTDAEVTQWAEAHAQSDLAQVVALQPDAQQAQLYRTVQQARRIIPDTAVSFHSLFVAYVRKQAGETAGQLVYQVLRGAGTQSGTAMHGVRDVAANGQVNSDNGGGGPPVPTGQALAGWHAATAPIPLPQWSGPAITTLATIIISAE